MLLLALVLLRAQIAATTPVTPAIETAQNAVVAVLAYDREGHLLRTAAGFQTGEPGEVVTVAPALRQVVRARVVTPEGKSFGVQTVLLDARGSGLARLTTSLPATEAKAIAVAQQPLEPETRVLIPVRLSDNQKGLLAGRIEDVQRTQAFGTYYRVLLPELPMNVSLAPGLPVITEGGKLAGVVLRRFVDAKNVYLAVPAWRLPQRDGMSR